MLRKLIYAIIAIATIGLSARADMPAGTWKVYSLFGDGVDKVIETPSKKVYYLSTGSLYSYDPQSGETYAYTTQNKLTGENISGIFYNYNKKYLAVAYQDGNIDIIYDNGKSVMLPDIKDAPINTTLGINDIAFHGDNIYVATDFGMVVFDDKKFEVKEYGIYNKAVNKILVTDSHIMIKVGSAEIRKSPVNERHNSFEKFTTFFGSNVQEWIYLGGDKVAIILPLNGTNTIRVYELDFNFNGTGDYDKSMKTIAQTPVQGMAPTADGGIFMYTTNNISMVDANGNITSTVTLPSGLAGNTMSAYRSLDSVWAANDDGIGCYDVTGSTLTVLSDRYAPEAVSCPIVQWLIPSPDGKRLYLSNIEGSQYRTSNPGAKDANNIEFSQPQRTNVIDLETGEIKDVSVKDVDLSTSAPGRGDFNSMGIRAQRKYGNQRIYGGVQRLCEDPSDPSTYWLTVLHEGLFRIKDAKVDMHFNYYDGFTEWRAFRPFDVTIDPEGNLWFSGMAQGDIIFHILPKHLRTITREEYDSHINNNTTDEWGKFQWIRDSWLLYTIPGYGSSFQKDQQILMCKKSNMILFINGAWCGSVYFIDTKGTYADFSDDTVRTWGSFTDQDGKSVNPVQNIVLREDNDGRVWLGTSDGILEFTNPTNGTNPNFTVKRLKVPRNDGTGQADYLLDGVQVNDISVDAANRKWIATETGGLYLVSPNGDEIIANFNTTNSDITTNCIYSVYADPNSNIVYVGTGHGLLAYGGTASAAAEDYSNVYIYPNPVRPDYSGWVTITGLMDNSLVKIVDAAGATVFQTVSEGGMAQWDACNASGHRVRSGVYYVYASQNADGGSASVVGKIVVVN